MSLHIIISTITVALRIDVMGHIPEALDTMPRVEYGLEFVVHLRLMDRILTRLVFPEGGIKHAVLPAEDIQPHIAVMVFVQQAR
ncbi:MAG: hypothetical protein M1524_00915 [Patescibacteria group bacterium]|nr:hypothetical protein [Patescibacteria group bacterium]